MDPVATTLEPVTAAQIRKDWAARGHPVSRQYVAKLIKIGVRDGAGRVTLDTSSLEAAWAWRTQRTDISKLAEGGRTNSAADGSMTRVSLKSDQADSLEAMLERVRAAEFQAAKRWEELLVAKKYDAINAESAER